MANLGAVCKECAYVASSVERPSEDFWVAMRVGLRWARLLHKRPQALRERQDGRGEDGGSA